MITADDAVVLPGQPVTLTAYTERNIFWGVRAHKSGYPVQFVLKDQPVGEATSDQNACARIDHPGVPGDLSTFEVIAPTMPGEPRAIGRIYRFDPTRTIVACDIDECLMQTRYSSAIFYHEDHVSRAFPGAAEAMQELSRDCHILYMSARPRFYYNQTREWLTRHGFPDGPILLSPHTRSVLRQTPYKRERVAQWRERWPNLVIGIGDNKSDTGGYTPNGLLAIIVNPYPRKNAGRDAVFLPDWAAALRFFRLNRDVLRDPRAVESAVRGEIALRRPATQSSGDAVAETDVPILHISANSATDNEGPEWQVAPWLAQPTAATRGAVPPGADVQLINLTPRP